MAQREVLACQTVYSVHCALLILAVVTPMVHMPFQGMCMLHMRLHERLWKRLTGPLLPCAAFAYATAALSPSMDVANAMFLTIPGIMLFACGYLIRYHDIKAWLKWCAESPASPCDVHPRHILKGRVQGTAARVQR